jgi:hypothetical protein
VKRTGVLSIVKVSPGTWRSLDTLGETGLFARAPMENALRSADAFTTLRGV